MFAADNRKTVWDDSDPAMRDLFGLVARARIASARQGRLTQPIHRLLVRQKQERVLTHHPR